MTLENSMMFNVVAVVAVASVFIYLGLFYRFVRTFRRRHPDMWKRLGCPETFGVQGQVTHLWIILGLEKSVPLKALGDMRRDAAILRILLVTEVLAFLTLAVLTG
jgi:hypothetical protein